MNYALSISKIGVIIEYNIKGWLMRNDKRWLCKFKEKEIEVWAKDEKEVKQVLNSYGYVNNFTITEIEKSPNDIQPIE